MSRFRSSRAVVASFLAAAILYFCFFSGLGAFGLVGPDEPRYAAVARAMAQDGDWVTPHLYGRPWFEKPILYYWAAAAAFRAVGVSETASRLPSALAALLAALAIAWAAWKLYGAPTACATLLIFPTSVGVFGFARAATPDMLFSAFLAVAMVAALWAVRDESRAQQTGADHPAARGPIPCALVVFGVGLGLATLAKGPAAIALAGGSAGLWALVTRRWRPAFRLFHPAAVVPFCVVALPWYVVCARRNQEFLGEFLILHNFRRYLTPVFQHVQPWWFFAPVLLLGLVPWTALLGGVLRDGVRLLRRNTWEDSPGLFFACWTIFPIVFFSFSESKLPGYVLPVFPALVLLVSHSLVRAIGAVKQFDRWLLAAVGLTWLALAASASHWLKRLPAEWLAPHPHLLLACLCSTAAAGSVIALLAILGKPWAAVVVSAILTAGWIVTINLQVLPQLDPYLSARAAAQLAKNLQPGNEAVEVYHLERTWQYGLDYYAGKELRQWSAQDPGPAWVYTDAAGVEGLARSGRLARVIGLAAPGKLVLAVIAAGAPATHRPAP